VIIIWELNKNHCQHISAAVLHGSSDITGGPVDGSKGSNSITVTPLPLRGDFELLNR